MSYSVQAITKYESKRNPSKVKIDDILININKGFLGDFDTVSYHEVLENLNRKIYFDIEKIDKPDLIYEIINELIKFYETKGLTDIKYILTLNESSPHEGYSYHLIFWNYACNYLELKESLKEFMHITNNKYNAFIDLRVYSNKRLFKLPYNYGVKQNTGIDLNSNNYHRIIIPKKDKIELDSEGKLTKQFIKRILIQDITNIPVKRIKINPSLIDAINKINYVNISAGDKTVSDDVIDKLNNDINKV